MEYETIRFETEGGVALLTLDRPERLNAMNRQLSDEVIDAIDRVRRDAGSRVLVLTGAGRAFCAGGDVRTGDEVGVRRTAIEARDWLREMG